MFVPICVTTSMYEPLVVDQMYHSCLISLERYDTWVDLIIPGMIAFNVILGMD